jgi:hypothetical protein
MSNSELGLYRIHLQPKDIRISATEYNRRIKSVEKSTCAN